MDRLQSFGSVRAIDEENYRVTVVVSTGDLARDGAIIEPAGWDLRSYERNPVVLWAHNDRELPIARTIESTVTTTELIQVHQFRENERSLEIFDAVREGFINATSVRWNPVRWEFRQIEGQDILVYLEQELLESSYVPIPADPGALVLRADGSPLDIESFRPPTPDPTPQEVAEQERAAGLVRLADALETATQRLKGA